MILFSPCRRKVKSLITPLLFCVAVLRNDDRSFRNLLTIPGSVSEVIDPEPLVFWLVLFVFRGNWRPPVCSLLCCATCCSDHGREPYFKHHTTSHYDPNTNTGNCVSIIYFPYKFNLLIWDEDVLRVCFF